MFRVTQFLKEIKNPTAVGPKRRPPGPVVIWNLIRRCNLACLHCYTNSMDKEFSGELTTKEVFEVMMDLKNFKVPVLILSGGEPLLREDIFEIAHRAKELGFYVGLSTNGTKITQENIQRIADVGFNYVGISLDGIGKVHDQFRRQEGAYEAALAGIRLCKAHQIKVGIRFTLTQENYMSLPELLDLQVQENIDKFYLSHLNYSGRGNKNRKSDAHFEMTKNAMTLIYDRAWAAIVSGQDYEFVTGNNDADAVFLLHWIQKSFPQSYEHVYQKMREWGGNQTGVSIANIDNLGNIHPDSFFWDYTLGNVRERKFSEVWMDTSDPLMVGLKKDPREIKGRCSACGFFDVCNGNTRTRAYQVSKDPWAEDPGCYLSDSEIGLKNPDTALLRGIEIVGVGKKGSEDCSQELIEELKNELKASGSFSEGRVDGPWSAQWGAFLGALWMKGPTPVEVSLNEVFGVPLLSKPQAMVDWLLQEFLESTPQIKQLLLKIISKAHLSAQEMEDLGGFLFLKSFPDRAKSFVASALRVRYTEPEEYLGLARAIEKNYNSPFAMPQSGEANFWPTSTVKKGMIQFADPFDGVTRSDILTPLLAHQFVKKGYQVFQMVGESSGPKFGRNALDLAQIMSLSHLKSNMEIPQGNFGSVLVQSDLSEALVDWVELRKKIKKRPFLSTLERFLNPMRAEYLFVSAFHATFTDKMVDIGELLGFSKIVVIFKSVEGQLGLSLGRATEVQISIKQNDGTYRRSEEVYSPEQFGIDKTPDPKSLETSNLENRDKILKYIETEGSGDSYFDQRAKYSLLVYEDLLRKLQS